MAVAHVSSCDVSTLQFDFPVAVAPSVILSPYNSEYGCHATRTLDSSKDARRWECRINFDYQNGKVPDHLEVAITMNGELVTTNNGLCFVRASNLAKLDWIPLRCESTSQQWSAVGVMNMRSLAFNRENQVLRIQVEVRCNTLVYHNCLVDQGAGALGAALWKQQQSTAMCDLALRCVNTCDKSEKSQNNDGKDRKGDDGSLEPSDRFSNANTIWVHKCVMAARSPVLQTFLENAGGWKDAEANEFQLKNTSVEMADILVEYLYLDRLTNLPKLSWCQLEELYQIGDYLQLPDMCKQIEPRLVLLLTVQLLPRALAFLKLYPVLVQLEDAVNTVVKQHPKQMVALLSTRLVVPPVPKMQLSIPPSTSKNNVSSVSTSSSNSQTGAPGFSIAVNPFRPRFDYRSSPALGDDLKTLQTLRHVSATEIAAASTQTPLAAVKNKAATAISNEPSSKKARVDSDTSHSVQVD